MLVRLYRNKKRCGAEGRTYRKCQQLAAELIALLATALPDWRLVVVGDAAYTNKSLIKGRPRNVTIVGRSRRDAAIYEPPPPRRPGQMGRPRVRGAKLPSPEAQAADAKAPWRRLRVTVYGKTVTVRALVIDALWYVAGGSELMRLVLVRGFPGHERDDVFISTDPTMSATRIVETIAQRWSIEVTFHDAKGKFGFEDPQNRAERAARAHRADGARGATAWSCSGTSRRVNTYALRASVPPCRGTRRRHQRSPTCSQRCVGPPGPKDFLIRRETTERFENVCSR